MARLLSAISILFWTSVAFGQSVSLDRFAKKFQLSVVEFPDLVEGDLNATSSGEFYQYTKPIEGKTEVGLLRPMFDPSFLHTRKGVAYPGNMITDGKIPESTASAFQNKLEQLSRLQIYGGPRLEGLAKIPVGDNLFDLAIMVEHIEGERVPLQVKDRPSWLQRSFIEKFNNFYRIGFIPLDYKTDSLLYRPSGNLRPFDVVLVKSAEMSRFAHQDSGLAHLRRLQLAQSIFQMEKTTEGDKSESSNRCRKIIETLRNRYPEAINHEISGVEANYAPVYSGAP